MQIFDDLKRSVVIRGEITKIISLCPSITETLCDLGLSEKVVGRTKYCIHPKDDVQNIPIVGDIKNVSLDKIKEINPDIVFALKQENDKETIEKIAENFPVFVFDICSVEDSQKMIISMGQICNIETSATSMFNKIKQKLSNINKLENPLKYIYFVWKNPYMAAGKETFIDSHLSKYGLLNCIENYPQNYATLDENDFSQLDPDIIFLPSEPFVFKENDKFELQQHFPDKKILLVEGEMFCWFGSRLVKSIDYILKIIRVRL